MAPSFTGHFDVDAAAHYRLCHNALRFAKLHLKPKGHFIIKLLRGGNEQEFRKELEDEFESVQLMKPAASRKESTEIYAIATSLRID